MTTQRGEPHSFIVKVWLEETAGPSSVPVWRGHVTHVPSRKRVYFQDMVEIVDFIRGFFAEASAKD